MGQSKCIGPGPSSILGSDDQQNVESWEGQPDVPIFDWPLGAYRVEHIVLLDQVQDPEIARGS